MPFAAVGGALAAAGASALGAGTIAAAAAGAIGSAAAGYIGGQITGSGQSKRVSEGQAQALAAQGPYSEVGTSALYNLGDLQGLRGPEAATTARDAFTTSPGYDWQVSEGLKAVDHGAAAKGLLRSGATLRAEQTLGSNLANQEFSTYQVRRQPTRHRGSSPGRQRSRRRSMATRWRDRRVRCPVC
jgi:hypothetical protein